MYVKCSLRGIKVKGVDFLTKQSRVALHRRICPEVSCVQNSSSTGQTKKDHCCTWTTGKEKQKTRKHHANDVSFYIGIVP